MIGHPPKSTLFPYPTLFRSKVPSPETNPKMSDTVHHKTRIGRERFLPAVARTVAAMAEPMVSHDAVAFNLLSEDVSKHVKVVQSGQGADEILAGYSWYPPLADVPREQAVDAYAREFFDRPEIGGA